jgi:hypothetical protein
MTSFERGFERPFERGSNGFERLCFAHPPYPPIPFEGVRRLLRSPNPRTAPVGPYASASKRQ